MLSKKLRILLFCTTCIFLCALSSSKAQTADEWNIKAIECERLLFEADENTDVEAILLEKARYYKNAGRYEDACATLSRIKPYLLEESEMDEVIFEKELCSYLAGDFVQAASYVSESRRWDDEALTLHSLVMAADGKYSDAQELASMIDSIDTKDLAQLFSNTPEIKSENKALIRSFLPPLGHLYTGNDKEGWLSAGLNAGSVLWMATQLAGGYWISGFLGGAIALNYTFMGNLERTEFLVKKYNTNSKMDFCEELKTVLQQIRYE